VRWADFRADIEVVTETKPEERKSNAGRKPYATILKFKIVVLQSLLNLSDQQSGHLIRDRLSFMRLLDLQLEDPCRCPGSATRRRRTRRSRPGRSVALRNHRYDLASRAHADLPRHAPAKLIP
jgi:transposase-like protein DUF772